MRTHGTQSGYKGGCRCRDCKDAVMAAIRNRQARGLADDDPRHGTTGGYSNWGCRCVACSSVWVDHHREYMNANPAQMAKHAERRRALYRAQKKNAGQP